MQQQNIRANDPVIAGQRFALITIVGPQNTNQKSDNFLFKIRAVANDKTELNDYVQSIRRFDKVFDLMIVEVGRWFPFIVDPHKVRDLTFENKQVDQVLSRYKEAQDIEKEDFENHRKQCIEVHKNDLQLTEKDKAVNQMFKILQLEKLAELRKQQFTESRDDFEKWFTKEDRLYAQQLLDSYSCATSTIEPQLLQMVDWSTFQSTNEPNPIDDDNVVAE